MEWDEPLWEHDWAGGLRMLQMGVHTHLITCRAAIRSCCAPRSPRHARPRRGDDGRHLAGERRVQAECRLLLRPRQGQRRADRQGPERGTRDSPVTAVGVTPGWLRSERMLENFGVTEANWRDACRSVPASGSRSRLRMWPEALPHSPGPQTPSDGQARSSALASSPTPTASQTPTEAGRTAGAITPPTAGSPKTAAASTSSGERTPNEMRRREPPRPPAPTASLSRSRDGLSAPATTAAARSLCSSIDDRHRLSVIVRLSRPQHVLFCHMFSVPDRSAKTPRCRGPRKRKSRCH